MSLQAEIQQIMRKRLRSLMRHRECFVAAYCAKYGVREEDVGDLVLVQQDCGDGRVEVWVEPRRRSGPTGYQG